MPSNTQKSAAVPFVNQKGERSMKRVRVERYVAGKKPAYAKEEDDDDEYYTTDEEGEYEEEEEEEHKFHEASTSRFKSLGYSKDDEDSSSGSDDSNSHADIRSDLKSAANDRSSDGANLADDDDDDEDDPRFMRLKQIERSRTSSATQVHEAQQRVQQIMPTYDIKNVILDEDDDEEQIRQRHALARKRQLEAPIWPKALTASSTAIDKVGGDESEDSDGVEGSEQRQVKRLDTDDLLKDLKLTGISRLVREKLKTEEEQRADELRLREILDKAKFEASLTSEINKKVDEDIKKQAEREALAKGDIGAREMSSVITDDEDDDLAYEEWKLREIKRVLRDRSERMLVARAR